MDNASGRPGRATNGSVLLRLKSVREKLGNAEARVARYIDSEPVLAANCSVTELAKRSGVSYATIIRLSKRLGYPGFRELQRELVVDIARQRRKFGPGDVMSVSPDSTLDQVCTAVSRFTMHEVEDTMAILDQTALAGAIEAICACPFLCAIGAGTSAVSAQYAFTKFFRIGVRCVAESDAVLQSMRAETLGEPDVLLAISSSGRTTSVVDAARTARERGAVVVSLTD
ncbi:MAG: MurR/RpiR family transcriptional regulator, partial [bacterium]